MFAFNRRLDPPTILGMPNVAFGGLLVLIGAVVVAVSYRILLLQLLMVLPALVGITIIVLGFRRHGREHLLGTELSGKRDLAASDWGIGADS